jgi:phosphate transporter
MGRIYTLEKQVHSKHAPPAEDAESSPLLNGSADDPDKVFAAALDHELEKICSFYQLKELEIYGEVDSLVKDEEDYEHDQEEIEESTEGLTSSRLLKKSRERSGSIFRSFGFGGSQPRRTSTFSRSQTDDGEDSDETDERTSLRKRRSRDGPRAWDAQEDDLRTADFASRRRASVIFDDYTDQALSALYDSGVTLKKRTISHYVSLCELRSFIQLNRTGFSKVLKKYDKIMDRNLKSAYIEEFVEPAYTFQRSTMAHLGERLHQVEEIYSRIVTNGDMAEAKRELRLHLREHVVWERNTVWREMIGIERKAQAANMGLRQTLLGRETDPRKARLQGDDAEVEMKEFVTPLGRYRRPSWLVNSSFYTLLVIFAVFFALIFVPIMKKPEQQNCLALVVFVSLLWATEVRKTW